VRALSGDEEAAASERKGTLDPGMIAIQRLECLDFDN